MRTQANSESTSRRALLKGAARPLLSPVPETVMIEALLRLWCPESVSDF